MLTRRLRELTECGIIDRYVYYQVSPKVDYSLTTLGLKLKLILYAIHDWGEEAEKRRSRSKK